MRSSFCLCMHAWIDRIFSLNRLVSSVLPTLCCYYFLACPPRLWWLLWLVTQCWKMWQTLYIGCPKVNYPLFCAEAGQKRYSISLAVLLLLVNEDGSTCHWRNLWASLQNQTAWMQLNPPATPRLCQEVRLSGNQDKCCQLKGWWSGKLVPGCWIKSSSQ